MATPALRRKVGRLEARAEAAFVASLEPPPGMTVESARRRLQELSELAKARRAEIEAAQASDDPKRRAWARKFIKELKGDAQAQARRDKVWAVIAAIQARHRGTVPNSAAGSTS